MRTRTSRRRCRRVPAVHGRGHPRRAGGERPGHDAPGAPRVRARPADDRVRRDLRPVAWSARTPAALLADGVARAHAADPGLEVTTVSRDGYASQALVDASRTAALVVVGAMGHGVLSRASVGAVAMQVVTHARCPVLVVGHETTGPAGPDGRVVVGVDGSKPSLRALDARSTRPCSPGPRSTSCTPGRRTAPPTPRWRPTRAGATYGSNLESIVEVGPHREARAAPRRQGRLRGRPGGARAGARRAQRGGHAARRRQPRLGWLRGAARRLDGACSSWAAARRRSSSAAERSHRRPDRVTGAAPEPASGAGRARSGVDAFGRAELVEHERPLPRDLLPRGVPPAAPAVPGDHLGAQQHRT